MQLFGSKMPTNDKCAFAPLLLHTYIQNKVTSPKKKNIQQILFLLPKKYDNNAIVWHHLKILLHFWASCFFSVYVLHLLIFTSANPFWLKNDIAIWHWTFFNDNEYALLYYIALVVVFFWQNLNISRIFLRPLFIHLLNFNFTKNQLIYVP